MDKEGNSFKDLKEISPHLSDAKLKEGTFIGPQMKKLLDFNIL